MVKLLFFMGMVIFWVIEIVTLFLPFIFVLLAVAFFTLLERKLLGAIMLRKGPNKVGFMGLLQPFSDAGKLFCKELVFPQYSNIVPFIICPGFMLGLSLSFWIFYPFMSLETLFMFGFLQFLVISSMSVYGVMVAGWSSNSKYSLLGSVRSVAQSISYEIPFMLLFFTVVFLGWSFFLQELSIWQEGVMFFGTIYLFGVMEWVVCLLAENNRAPFDFVEGESELVSGFNVEYSGGMFAMIFMSEYSSMMFGSLLTGVLFWGGSEVFFSVVCVFFILFFVWVRGTYPRMRYDKLMKLGWTSFAYIPLVFILFIMIILLI
uniref:NADH-ubiquinone oxidoreductase chain 1 n=1 Tax=Geukensia demissa TaxID=27807 RepID=A0A6B9VRF8_GEUDE|nr:NADH dehydrogenase subunit 1 [Geukensia demissa]